MLLLQYNNQESAVHGMSSAIADDRHSRIDLDWLRWASLYYLMAKLPLTVLIIL